MSLRDWKCGRIVCTDCAKTRFFTCSRCQQDRPVTDRHLIGEFTICDTCRSELKYWASEPNPVENPTFNVIGSRRRYGIELESHTDTDHRLLKLRKKSRFGAKSDCTVGGKEFYSPILCGDEGLQEINTLCEVANELGWQVDINCGYHLHLDVQGETVEKLRSIAYAFMCLYDVLRRCVSSNRHNTSYSCQHICPNEVENCGDFLYWARRQERYNFLNVSAYFQHGTFENRQHEGTFDRDAVTNWVIMNLQVADAAATYSVSDLKNLLHHHDRTTMDKWVVVKKWVKDPSVIAFYENRIRASRCSWFPNNSITSTISA